MADWRFPEGMNAFIMGSVEKMPSKEQEEKDE
jgi:hypothetical protein